MFLGGVLLFPLKGFYIFSPRDMEESMLTTANNNNNNDEWSWKMLFKSLVIICWTCRDYIYHIQYLNDYQLQTSLQYFNRMMIFHLVQVFRTWGGGMLWDVFRCSIPLQWSVYALPSLSNMKLRSMMMSTIQNVIGQDALYQVSKCYHWDSLIRFMSLLNCFLHIDRNVLECIRSLFI